MAGKKSLPDVSQKVIANAEQYINEFKRAAKAQKGSTAEMDRELDKLHKSVGRKFKAADIGKDVLRGFGIGSGFQLADTAISKWIDLFQEADKKAKEAATSIAELNKQFHDLANQRFESSVNKLLPEQQLAARQKQIEELTVAARDLTGIQADLAKDMAAVDSPGQGYISGTALDATKGKYGYGHTRAGLGDIIGEKMDENAKQLKEKLSELQRIKDEAAKLTAEINKGDTKLYSDTASKAAQQHIKDLEADEKAREAIAAGIKKQDDELARLAATFAEMADPSLKFTKEIEQVNLVLDAGKISAEQAAGAISHIRAEMAKVLNEPLENVRKQLFGTGDEMERLYEKADETSKAIERSVNHAADAMGDAWVDAINGVEGAWGDLGNTVIREIEGIIAKVLIVTPLMHGLGAIFGSFGGGGVLSTLAGAFSGYGGGKAAGGPVDAGTAYKVGEQGEEMFVPHASGTIIPNHALRAARAGISGNNYYIDARGADQGAVDRLQAALLALAGPGVVERRAAAAGFDSRRRGGS